MNTTSINKMHNSPQLTDNLMVIKLVAPLLDFTPRRHTGFGYNNRVAGDGPRYTALTAPSSASISSIIPPFEILKFWTSEIFGPVRGRLPIK